MHKRKGFFVGEKKGISVMVGYVLLIVFVIIIGGIVYQWLKTYIPAQALECPDGVSLFIKEAEFNDSNSRLMITLRNNGRFNLGGYFIHATNSSDQELPIIDLSGYLNYTDGPGRIHGNSVLFFDVELVRDDLNLFAPGSEGSYFFDIPSSIGEPYVIRITPTRFQDVDERERFVSCSNAGAEQLVGEVVEECISEDISVTCGTWVCGQRVNNCDELVLCPPGCTDPEVCNSTGQCIPPEECTDTCETYGYECGTWEICGISTDCDGCEIGYSCNATGQCVSNVNNGVCDPEETCADADCEGQQNGCEENYICLLGSCVLDIPGTIANCADYCVFLGNYIGGNCRQNPAQCTVNGEVYESGGDPYCTVPLTNNCCCVP